MRRCIPEIRSIATSRRRAFRLAAGAAALSIMPRTVRAQAYPTRPITIVVAYPPGAATDIVARILSENLPGSLGQPVIVENVAGANGSIGAGRVARAAPDGYTLIVGNWNNFVANGAVYALKFDLKSDFTPIALLSETPVLITARGSLSANDLRQFIAWLKANPGTATEGHAGIGSIGHLVGVLLQKETGTRFHLIPYRGGGPAVQDLPAGHIDFMLNSAPDTLSQVRVGAIKAYAVTAGRRLPALPGVPTVDEAGLPGFYFTQWFGLWGPRGMANDTVEKLNAAVVRGLGSAAVQSKLSDLGQQGFPAAQQTPHGLAALHLAEIEKWWPIIKEANIKAE
jgi:tripartite-type tricarboxylate transporter receptor subunit TctC